jgi:putative peptidoglycan lipid II flippase
MGSRTVLARAFYALLNTRTPLYVSAVDVAANVVLSILLVMTPLRHGGLALATSLASILHAWLLKVMLEREMTRQGRRLVLQGLTPAILRMMAAGLLMGLAAWGALAALSAAGLGRGLVGTILCVLVPGGVGLAVYVGAAALLGCEEVRRLIPRRSRG